MKKSIKRILALVFSIAVFSTSVFAIDTTATLNEANGPETRSISKTVYLDFTENTSWLEDFDNGTLIGYNHNNLSVKYASNTPNVTPAYVWVELYIDEDEDGVFERIDPEGSYRFGLRVGETLQISLPSQREEKDYRLLITNRTNTVEQGVFEIKSYYNAPT